MASTTQGGTFTLTPSAANSQQCVCTTCHSERCASRFWLPGSNITCPFRPQLHFRPNVTTFFRFPQESTGQQPSVSGLAGGNWCRFRMGEEIEFGYLRGGACHSANLLASFTFEIFCPYAVSSCSSACGHDGLVNPTTRASCACDYWCQLYGDCCGDNPNSIASQCPAMAPSANLATTGSCRDRKGVATNQAMCASYRPGGMTGSQG